MKVKDNKIIIIIFMNQVFLHLWNFQSGSTVSWFCASTKNIASKNDTTCSNVNLFNKGDISVYSLHHKTWNICSAQQTRWRHTIGKKKNINLWIRLITKVGFWNLKKRRTEKRLTEFRWGRLLRSRYGVEWKRAVAAKRTATGLDPNKVVFKAVLFIVSTL